MLARDCRVRGILTATMLGDAWLFATWPSITRTHTGRPTLWLTVSTRTTRIRGTRTWCVNAVILIFINNIHFSNSLLPQMATYCNHIFLSRLSLQVQGCAPDVYGYYDSYDSSQNSSPQNITSYTGPGLENRECPVAFNPRVIDKTFNNGTKYIANYTHLKEIQRIECKAVQGYVTLQFRGMTSGQIHVNSTVAEVTAKLEAVPSVGDVSVKFALPSNNFCEYALSQYADITFESELGNVPLLAVAESL